MAHPMRRGYVPEKSFCKLRRAPSPETMIRDSAPGRPSSPAAFCRVADPSIFFLEIHRSHSYSACVTRMAVADHSILCPSCSSLDSESAERYLHAAVQFGPRHVARIDLCTVNVTVSSSNKSKRGSVRGGAGSARCGKFAASVRNLPAALLALSGIRM